jgi:hypothetical protein
VARLQPTGRHDIREEVHIDRADLHRKDPATQNCTSLLQELRLHDRREHGGGEYADWLAWEAFFACSHQMTQTKTDKGNWERWPAGNGPGHGCRSQFMPNEPS